MTFEELDLNDNVLDALYDMRFETCTPIQEHCIPQILEGKDILGVAQTGTGKTGAYLLPIMSMLDDGGFPHDAINCIIMAPTRELAQQIDQAMQGFGYYLDSVSSLPIYGGNDGNRYDQEIKSLRLGADIIIATPGRFISHIQLGNVDLSKVSFFVLDEADRMLDMGFSEDIMTIAKQLPPTCQTIMFSATMPPKIEQLAKTLLKNPVEIKKINSDEMHSDLSQEERDQVMFKFKSGATDVLVATDILSRGIDIDDITMVINYDVPHDVEDYVHRIGRTARAERDGVAFTLISDQDVYYFQQIERFLEKEIERVPLPEGIGDGPEYKTASRAPQKGGSRGSYGGRQRQGQPRGGRNRNAKPTNQHTQGGKSGRSRGSHNRRKPNKPAGNA